MVASEIKSSLKTPQELGITEHEWVNLAESLLLSREFVSLLSDGPLYHFHRMQVDYLEDFFGLKQPTRGGKDRLSG